MHTCFLAKVPIDGSAAGARLSVFRFEMKLYGYCWWWPLRDLVPCTLLPSEVAQRRGKAPWFAAQKKMQAWERLCEECGLPAVRKSMPFATKTDIPDGDLAKAHGEFSGRRPAPLP